jgi:AcrR family transcriptional regulator
MRIFGRRGYHAGTLQMIAHDIGVTPAALASLFGSKQGLLFAVMEESDRRAAMMLRSVTPGLDHLRALARLASQDVPERGLMGLHVVLAAEAANPSHPLHAYMAQRYEAIRESIKRQLLVAVDQGQLAPLDEHRADVEAGLLIAAMDGLQLQWLLHPSDDLAGRFRYTLDLTISRLAR